MPEGQRPQEGPPSSLHDKRRLRSPISATPGRRTLCRPQCMPLFATPAILARTLLLLRAPASHNCRLGARAGWGQAENVGEIPKQQDKEREETREGPRGRGGLSKPRWQNCMQPLVVNRMYAACNTMQHPPRRKMHELTACGATADTVGPRVPPLAGPAPCGGGKRRGSSCGSWCI